LLDGDAAGAYHFVTELLSSGVPFDAILFDLFAPVEADLGSRWEYGDYEISREHAATGAVETLLALLTGTFEQPEEGDLVVIAAAEGDDHALPGRMVSAYLLYLGYRVLYLGSSVPADDLGGFIEEEQPAALVLSCAMATHLPGARASIAAANGAGVPVIAGGRGFGTDGRWARRLGADAWARHPREIDALLEAGLPAPGNLPSLEDDAAATLVDQREVVLAAAITELGSAATGRLRRELALLFDSVIAAVLVDDPAVVGETVAWQDAMLDAQGHGADAGDRLVEALRSALADRNPKAAALLEAGAR
jgi:methanogenic corrinoid protein MtbC1